MGMMVLERHRTKHSELIAAQRKRWEVEGEEEMMRKKGKGGGRAGRGERGEEPKKRRKGRRRRKRKNWHKEKHPYLTGGAQDFTRMIQGGTEPSGSYFGAGNSFILLVCKICSQVHVFVLQNWVMKKDMVVSINGGTPISSSLIGFSGFPL